MGHARALLSLEAEEQKAIARQIVAKGLTVRQTETLVRNYQERKNKPEINVPEAPSADIRNLEEELSQKLGAGGSIQHTAKGKGKIGLNYKPLARLDGRLAHAQ